MVTVRNCKLILIAGFLILSQAFKINAQELPADTVSSVVAPPDTSVTLILPSDTIVPPVSQPLTKKVEEEHSPRKAAIYSAILPGLGQAYNKKYWKIPLVYGGFAAFGYFIGWNNNNYQISKNAYRDLTDSDDSTTSYMNLKQIIYYNLDNPSDVERLKYGLLRRQDYFRRNRDLLVILTVGFYGLNIIDASVDAHFFNWDISDDLTLRWQPTIDQWHNKNIFALNCTIRF